MGEAKRRGSLEQRTAAALAAQRARFPDTVACNSCQASLSEISPIDVRGLEGLRAAGVAHCDSCASDTYVLDGEPEALEFFAEQMQKEGVLVGKAKRPERGTS